MACPPTIKLRLFDDAAEKRSNNDSRSITGFVPRGEQTPVGEALAECRSLSLVPCGAGS
jgi:hypothetical protein